MGRAGVAMLAALAVLAAACSDPSAFGPAPPLQDAPGEEVALGPTIDPEPPTTSLPIIPPLPPVPAPPPPPEPVTVLAVGNLGRCNAHSTGVTDALVLDAGLIFAAGDLSADGTQLAVEDCFLPALESDLDRIYAVPGDRDLASGDPAAYFAIVAQTPIAQIPIAQTPTDLAAEGWFVTSLGGWQIIGLNSRCDDVGGCDTDSEQYRWLDTVLREQPAECRVVMWHDARFTSALLVEDANDMGPIVGRLDGAGTDVLITGSPGNYERLGPLRPSGKLAQDGAREMMHFNIGGGSGAGFERVLQPGTTVRNDSTNGYVRFVFSPEGYTWEFVAVSAGDAEPDVGSGTC